MEKKLFKPEVKNAAVLEYLDGNSSMRAIADRLGIRITPLCRIIEGKHSNMSTERMCE